MAAIPEAPWFDLALYAPCIEWTPSDWLIALSARHVMQTQIDRALRGEPRQGFHEHAESHFACLREDVKVGYGALMNDKLRTSPWTLHNRVAENALATPLDDLGDLDKQFKFDAVDFGAVYVDLSAPDRVLIDAFARWLKEKRRDVARINVLTDLDLRTWVQCHALPYIDLRQYLKFTGRSVTYARVADVLFPNVEVDRVERLRKVTVKFADRLQTERLRSALAAQIGEVRSSSHRPRTDRAD